MSVHSVRLQWDPPPRRLRNGNIVLYEVPPQPNILTLLYSFDIVKTPFGIRFLLKIMCF